MLQGKRILVTGVLNDASIAFSTARLAQEQGAEVILSSFGRVMRLTERTAKRLPTPDVQIVELDVTNEDDLAALAGNVGGKLDGVLHSLAFAPESCLGGGFLDAPWEDVSVALHVSAYSLKALTVAALPLMERGGSIVGLDFDNDDVAWPVYDWMGVSKAAFESVARYLARDLGPAGHPGEPGERGPVPQHRGEEHPRLREVRGGLGRAGAAGLGPQGRRADRQGVRRAAVRLVPRHHRREGPRRRRLPRRRCLSAPDHRVRVRNCPDRPRTPTRGPVAGGLW